MANWPGDPQQLVAFWDLADTSPIARALGPTQLNGTYRGLYNQLGAGGVQFDGASAWVEIPPNVALDCAAEFMLLAVVKRGALGTNQTIMSKGAGGFQLRLDALGKPQLVKSGGAAIATGGAIDTGTHVITAAFDGLNGYLWVDGVYNGVGSAPAPVNTSWPLAIGRDTTAAGAGAEYFGGVILDVAVFQKYLPGAGAAVIPLVAGGLQAMPTIPDLLTTWRDPADLAASVYLEVPIACYPAKGTVTSLAAISTITQDPLPISNYRALARFPIAPAANGATTAFRATAQSSVGATSVDLVLHPEWALARLAPNISLGDHVANLGDSWAMLPNPAAWPDDGALFYRAATGPNPTDYAPGSSWRPSAAAVQAQLPAVGAFLAAQVQLVRRT
jgi:hypothetical protein